MMNLRLADRIGLLFCGYLLMIASAAAQISGTATNGTTNKPAAGDDVTLMSLANGMEEVGHTQTDAQGRFSFANTQSGVPHLVRVTHANVSYHQMVPPGRDKAYVTVYDVAKKVSNLIGEGHVFRFQTVGNDLEVAEEYILRNESNPPRTQMGDKGFEFTLPSGATIEEAEVAGPGGMPTNVTPSFAGKKDTYSFEFPLRPGKSQMQVTYKLPYSGERDFAITPDMPYAELGVMLPKTMKFQSSQSQFLQAQEEQGMTTWVAKSLLAGTTMRFTVSGQGTAPSPEQRTAAAQTGAGNAQATPTNPSSPPSTGYLVLAAAFVLLVAGGVYWLVRSRGGPGHRAPGKAEPGDSNKSQKRSASGASPAQDSVLNALKDELFQLETERVEGKISQAEYEKSKAGLEMLIRRKLASMRK